MKAVIDTNGFLSAIPTKGINKWLYSAFMDEKFTWVLSNEIMSEYSEKAATWYGEDTMNFVVNSLLNSVNHEKFEPSYKWQLVIADPDDNKFVDCAIGVGADYLVSDDKHIRNLLKIPNLFPPIPIITFKQFRKILENL
jgi:uncharacterized protein